jgi:RNA polymerase sigma-70 factor, ECF subfamily
VILCLYEGIYASITVCAVCNEIPRFTALLLMTPLRKTEANTMRTSMEDAYDEFEGGLNRHSFYKVNNKELSEDLVQDTFKKAWTYLVRGGKIDAMRGFLYHTLNCLIIDEYRKPKNYSLDILIEAGFEPSVNTTDQLINMLDGKAAFLLVERLPDKYKKTLMLRYVEHLSLKEIAKATGQSENTVAVQVHRGLKLLRALYEDPTAVP